MYNLFFWEKRAITFVYVIPYFDSIINGRSLRPEQWKEVLAVTELYEIIPPSNYLVIQNILQKFSKNNAKDLTLKSELFLVPEFSIASKVESLMISEYAFEEYLYSKGFVWAGSVAELFASNKIKDFLEIHLAELDEVPTSIVENFIDIKKRPLF